MENTEYNNTDLNELFNFSYNFDLLKGIIETLLKNQQNLQKQVNSMKENQIELQLLKIELKNTKKDLKKIKEIFQPNEEESDKSEKPNESNLKGEKTKKEANKNALGFGKFTNLKEKLLEFDREFEKTRINVNEINNKLKTLIGGDDTGNKMPLIEEMEKKLNFLLGDLTMEDIEDANKYREKKAAQEQSKIMNLQEIYRKLGRLEYNKIDSSVFDTKNDKIFANLEEVKNKLHELILNLYGYTGAQYDIDNNVKFVRKDEYEKFKTNIGYEIERIWTEITKIKESINSIGERIKGKNWLKDIEDNNHFIFEKIDGFLEQLDKKYVLKSDHSTSLKNLEEQFRRILLLLASKIQHENDNWLLAKKPITGYSCASCESYIGDLKEENNDKYINWKKMPIREREKETDQDKEKIYRIGNGYSHVLKMVDIDNNKNVSLKPNSIDEMKILFPSSIENNKIKDAIDIQKKKGPPYERTRSAHSKDSKEKTIKLIKVKNSNGKLPKIKGSTSTDNYDIIIENPNLNSKIKLKENNALSPKITKVMRKTHFN